MMLDEHVIHQSANRHHQLLGADRVLVVIAAMLCAGIGVSMSAWWGYIFALLLWFAAVYALRMMGKHDPLLRPVWERHRRYSEYYPAKSDVFSECDRTPQSWR